MPFEFEKLAIPDVILIKPKVFPDDRGYFLETYKESDFKKVGIEHKFIQGNHSFSQKGVVRGLHYQLNPKAQGKLVRVVAGKLIDYAVDIRKQSETYGQWVSAELSETNFHMLWVPPGFAHGIAILEDNTHLLYQATNEYSPKDERIIRWDDPLINIEWPIKNPILSKKDSQAPFLADAENNF